MKTENFFIVYKPTFESEMMDIFSGKATTLESLYNQFHGGLKPEMIHGIYTTKAEASSEADLLYKELLKTRNEDDPFSLPRKQRFTKFVEALGELSTKYGVAIHSTGGVCILKEKQKISYSKDHTSGDLECL